MFSLETAPLLLIWPALALALIVTHEIGFLIYRIAARRIPGVAEVGEKGVGYLLSTVFALLGLLIAFTFSMAADRYDTRRSFVVEEANAVGTTYLRFQLLNEPARAALSGLMLPYIQAREQFFAAEDATTVAAADALTNDLQTLVWSELSAALSAQPASTINQSLLEATNEMFDLAASDRAAQDARVPISILRALIGYSLIAAAFMGYAVATNGSRYLVPSTVLFVLIALSITLVMDLDRPRSGSVLVSAAPFSRAADGIRAMDAARAPKPP